MKQLELHVGQISPQKSIDFERNRALMHRLTGEAGDEFADRVRNKQPIPAELADRTNQYFYSALPDALGLPSEVFSNHFWLGKEMDAMRVHHLIVEKLPNLARSLEPTTEATTPTGRITDYLKVFHGGKPARYEHEMRRRLVLGLTSGLIEAQNIRYGLSTRLNDIESVFEEQLFKNGAHSKLFVIHAYHELHSNEVQGFGLRKGVELPEAQHRVHEFKVRQIPQVGKVFYTSRAKGYPEATLKALHKGLGNGGELKPSVDVQDRLGAMFVLMNPKIRSGYLHNKIHKVLQDNFGQVRVEEDSKPDGYKKDTTNPIKMSRKQYFMGEELPFDGTGAEFPFPFEGMVFRTEEYLDYLFALGNSPDPKDIKARSIYNIFRLSDPLNVLYPTKPELFDYNAEQEILKEVKRARERILSEGLLPEPTRIDFNKVLEELQATTAELIEVS